MTNLCYCSAFYGGYKRDTARIYCLLTVVLLRRRCCWASAVQQSIDISCSPGPSQHPIQPIPPYRYIDATAYYANIVKKYVGHPYSRTKIYAVRMSQSGWKAADVDHKPIRGIGSYRAISAARAQTQL